MVLIIGGAYQGKLDFAKNTFGMTDEDVFVCCGSEIDFSKRCVYALEEFTLACIQEEKDPKAYLQAHREDWENSIFICRDFSAAWCLWVRKTVPGGRLPADWCSI